VILTPAFRSDNGLYNLSRLSVFWLRLGIEIERIKPGNPQQNGRHERMHHPLKAETTRPALAGLARATIRSLRGAG
jgi:putative transposase